MNFAKIKLSFLLVAWLATAQGATDPKTIDLGFTPDCVDFSPDDRYLVAESEQRYQVWDIEAQTKVIDGKHAFKLGRFIKGLVVPTGSGYFLFGNEQVFMTVDYQNNQTDVKAFDLESGAMRWETDQLDMGITLAETILRAHGMANTEIEVAGQRHRYQTDNFFTKDKFLDRLINYIPELHAVAFNGKAGLQLVDIRSGKILWTQQDVKGGIGELLFDAGTNRLLAIKIPNSDGAIDQLSAQREVQALDANTGKLLWSVEYTGEFVPGYATLIGETLVLSYLELMLIDTKTGAEHNGDVKSRMGAARNVTKGLGGLMAIDKAMGGSFGAGTDNNSKYNRLIPRELLFNQRGKLCYFTMFNDKGKWGTGGKKGYVTIDIHSDKIETEEYGILDNQWTVMQDALVDGLFYVKASGNLNRTMITAVDAESGNVVFETNKAKNSADVAKAFNPFMVTNGRIVDIVSRGVYILDAKTGREISYTTTKDLGVGTIIYSRFYDHGILLFGTNGIAAMGFEGNVNATVTTKNIKDAVATEDEVWVLENKQFTRVDARQGEVLETKTFKQRENVFFSPSGQTLVKLDGSGKRLAIIAKK